MHCDAIYMLYAKQMTAAHFIGGRCAMLLIAFCAFHIHILPKCTKLTTMFHQTIWENIRAVENLFVTLMRLFEKLS